MRADKLTQWRAGLETLRARYDARFLSSDPLEFPRRFDRSEDREIVGLVASCLAYGNVATIRAMLTHLESHVSFDPQRVLLAGFSAGGAMSFYLLYVERFPTTAVVASAGRSSRGPDWI